LRDWSAVTTSIRELRTRDELHSRARGVETLQLNLTRLCNQACAHCHVAASPARTEMMPPETIAACLAALDRAPRVRTVDLTGGAPELHPNFRELVTSLRERDVAVIVRHNLTVTFEAHPVTGESMGWVPAFLAEQAVRLCCSLPCYLPENTDAQRGTGVFEASIRGLRQLNDLGFGVPGSALMLDLIHNPVGFGLPGDQAALEADYRRELMARHGVSFNALRSITNMPIARFGESLSSAGREREYSRRIADACNPTLGDQLMCRSLVSVSPDGRLFDCDFNQALGLGVDPSAPATIFDFDLAELEARPIRFGEHCLVCLAGAGSSCGGALLSA